MPESVDDRSWGAFTDDGPWTLDRSAIRWMPLAARLRAAAHAEVPLLTAPSKVPLNAAQAKPGEMISPTQRKSTETAVRHRVFIFVLVYSARATPRMNRRSCATFYICLADRLP